MIIIWQEKVAQFFGFKKFYWLFWILLGVLIFTFQFILIHVTDGTTNGLSAFGIYCFIISYSAILSIAIAKIFDQVLNKLKDYTNNANTKQINNSTIEKIFSIRRDLKFFSTIGVGYFVTLLLITKFFSNQVPWFGNIYTNIVATIAWLFWCFITVPQISMIWEIMLFSSKLKILNLSSEFFSHPINGINDLGRLFFIVSLNQSGILGLIYLGIYVSPVPIGWPAIFWMGIGGVCVFLSFLIPQINLHKYLLREKNNKIRVVSQKVELIFHDLDKSETLEHLPFLDHLYSIQSKLENLQEWSFDLKALLSIISLLILPILLIILNKLLII